jgi:hypothetical protein
MTRHPHVAIASLAVALGSGVTACAKPPPRTEIAARHAEVERVLAEARTEEQLTAFAGVPPRVCVPAPPSGRLCEWRLGDRDSGWRELARAVPTDDRINLLCVLPRSGHRGPDSCAVYPQRSNRFRYELPTSGTDPKARAARDQAELKYQRQATADLADAVTLVDLAGLMGAAPDSCVDQPDGMRSCSWLATGRTYGHGTLAQSLLASVHDKVEMQCALPADGSPRAAGSCRVQVPGHEYSGQR